MVHAAARRCLTAAGSFEAGSISYSIVNSSSAVAWSKSRSPGNHRSFATEATEFRHQNAAPPPPPPIIPRLPETTSPSRVSSTVTSSSSLSSSPANIDTTRQQDITEASYEHGLPAFFGRNQLDTSVRTIDPELQANLEAILAEFKAPIRYAFAYGSGVFKQAGYSQKEKPMLDFVFAVSHPVHWHSINVNQFKDHYSLMARIFGSRIISILQEKVGAGVWFNVECLVRGRIVKYGVISVDTLVHDLLDWESLYIAGRMHKPVHVLKDEPRVRLANQVNLSSAVRAAFLALPETFTEEDLYTEITSLSYRGDFRMQVGENPRKIKNIVSQQGEQFTKVYKPILQAFHKHISFMGPEGSGSIRQDINPRAKAELARRLPLKLREMLKGHYERESNILSALGKKIEGTEEQKPSLSEETALWRTLVAKGDFKSNLNQSIDAIVARPAFSQSMKGIASVGPIRGIRYVWPKLKKKWGSSSS